MDIEVIKRDGTVEKYDESKIARVAKAAGLNLKQAQELAAHVSSWFKENSLSKVSSLQIRDRVVEELKKANGYAADLYIWYEKTKDHS